ncbi:unnamed protein product [Closterium sp. Naga37s-1]|nr:unnamed protein product [Closterium sp. Naga37s-1]
MPLIGSAVKSAGRRHATRASSSSSALSRPPALDPTSPDHPPIPPPSASSTALSSFLRFTLVPARPASLPSTPAASSGSSATHGHGSAHGGGGSANGWTVCGWRVSPRLVASLALLSLATKLCGFLLLTFFLASRPSAPHSTAAGAAPGAPGSAVAAGSGNGGSGAGVGEVVRLNSELAVQAGATRESRGVVRVNAQGVCSPAWREQVTRHFGGGGRGDGEEAAREGEGRGERDGGGEREGAGLGERDEAHGRRLLVEGRWEEGEEGKGEEVGMEVERMMGRLCDEGLPLAAALFGVNHSTDATVQLACTDATSSSFPASSPTPTAFLYAAAVPEQLSKAKAHLIELAALARHFNRTLIVPRVGHSRVDFTRRLPFCAYFDASALQRCGVQWVTEDWFLEYARRRSVAVRPTYLCLVPGANDTCSTALTPWSPAFLSVLAIAHHPPSPANALPLRTAYHTRRERWGAQMEREEAALLRAMESAGRKGGEGRGAEDGQGQGQGERVLVDAPGSWIEGGDGSSASGTGGAGGGEEVDVVVVAQSSWFFTLREHKRASAASCLAFAPNLHRAAERFAHRMRGGGGRGEGGDGAGAGGEVGAGAGAGGERGNAAGAGSMVAVLGDGSDSRQRGVLRSDAREGMGQERERGAGRYAAVHLRLEFITFKASKAVRTGTAPIESVRAWLMACAASAVTTTRHHLAKLNSSSVFLAADVSPASPPSSSLSSPSFSPISAPSQPSHLPVRLQSDSWAHEGAAGEQLLGYVAEAYWHVRRELRAVVWDEEGEKEEGKQQVDMRGLDRGVRGVLDKLVCAEADVFVVGDDACGGMQSFDMDVCGLRKGLGRAQRSTVQFSRGRMH